MYSKEFYITTPVGNNAFSYEERKNKQLYVPSLKNIDSLDDVILLQSPSLSGNSTHPHPLSGKERGDAKVTFEDYNFDDKLQTCYGLENLYYISGKTLPQPLSKRGKKLESSIYLVDNHNHVLYFWYLARQQGIISDGATLYHIDEHADTRDPGEYLMKPESYDLQKVFEYTNFTVNVGNYIVPAQKEGLIGEVVQIRGEGVLNEYLQFPSLGEGQEESSIILNLDLDFFQPDLDYIDYELKKSVVLDITKKADLITICTSPFFIEQERALRVLKDLFTPLASQPQSLQK